MQVLLIEWRIFSLNQDLNVAKMTQKNVRKTGESTKICQKYRVIQILQALQLYLLLKTGMDYKCILGND